MVGCLYHDAMDVLGGHSSLHLEVIGQKEGDVPHLTHNRCQGEGVALTSKVGNESDAH